MHNLYDRPPDGLTRRGASRGWLLPVRSLDSKRVQKLEAKLALLERQLAILLERGTRDGIHTDTDNN